MECGKSGHFKCTSEKRSRKVKLTFLVEDNLDEFFIENNQPTGQDEPNFSIRKRDKKSQRKAAKKQR